MTLVNGTVFECLKEIHCIVHYKFFRELCILLDFNIEMHIIVLLLTLLVGSKPTSIYQSQMLNKCKVSSILMICGY